MKAILFDMDGVIFDSEKAYGICFEEIGKKYNLQNVHDVLLKCCGTNDDFTKKTFLDYYGIDFDYDAYAKELMELFENKYGNGKLPIKPGTKEILSYLNNSHYKVSLVSSTKTALVKQQLKDADLIQYFDCIVGGDFVSKSKPEPDIYLKACELLNVYPQESFAIEDSYNGIRSASSAGCKAIMVPDLIEPDDEMRQLSTLICTDLFEVLTYIQKQ